MHDAITCIIIDDEPKMVELLADSIRELFPNIEIKAQLNDWRGALEVLRTFEPDILFTDISMPEKTGFDLLELLPNLKSEIIFVTAHTEFALDAFNFDVCAYLLKPVSDKMLIKAVDRALTRIRAKNTSTQQPTNSSQKIGIPDWKGIHYIDIQDIMYCETLNRYTKVMTTKGEIVSSYSIGAYTKYLTNENFHHMHRSYIINLNFVKRYDTTGIVVMSDGKEIPIPKKNKDAFLKMFTQIGK